MKVRYLGDSDPLILLHGKIYEVLSISKTGGWYRIIDEEGKDEVVAQYALTGYDQPIGISDYQLSKAIPENLKSALPSIEEVEEELASFLDKDKNP